MQGHRQGGQPPDRDVLLPGTPVSQGGVREAAEEAGHGRADDAAGHGRADALVNPRTQPDMSRLRPVEVQAVRIAELARVAIPGVQEAENEGAWPDDLAGNDHLTVRAAHETQDRPVVTEQFVDRRPGKIGVIEYPLPDAGIAQNGVER